MLIKDIASIHLLDILYHTDGNGQDNDFIECLEHRLNEHHLHQFAGRHQASEGDRKENDGIGALAHQGRSDGTERKVLSTRGQLHFAHDIGIQERTCQKSGQTGHGDAGRHAEHEVEASSPSQNGAAGIRMASWPKATTMKFMQSPSK